MLVQKTQSKMKLEKYKIKQEERKQIKNNITKANEIKGLQNNEILQTNKNQIKNIADIKS